jgi:hypothetical protein
MRRKTRSKEAAMFKGAILWFLGVPGIIIVLLFLFHVI